jgi:pimeloyl-ACP methyl ester carboxylesterase
MAKKGISRRTRLLLAALALILIVATVGFVTWAETPLGPQSEAKQVLQSGAEVQVEENGWLAFSPTGAQPATGFIFYPGGRVDPVSYALAARRIASAGYLVVILDMPLNLAVFNPDAAGEVIAAYPEIENWVVGGHSLGGAMAARYASQNPLQVQGLVLWAAYPASGDDLSQSGLPVSSIYGTADGLATPSDVLAARELLPAATRWVEITGGNHSGFGWYGDQQGDGTAAISREEQQEQVIQATLELLSSIGQG